MSLAAREGSMLGGYRLIRQIGEGGMGAVWLAQHSTLGRNAAVKLLHPSFCVQPEIVARFFNEARAASTIADPGIVQIFDVGHHVDGTAYIVMELLEGESLGERLAKNGRIGVADSLRILRQVATSLGVAHARGIVHRDLKPENIFLTRDAEVAGGERAKILDFGIAKLSHDVDARVKTQTSAVMGTPTFMSPEQCRGAGGVDQRADVYSLGCVLFTLVVGRPPFVAEGIGDIIAMHLREPAPRASASCPWIPVAVDALIQRCLAKAPADRFASASELATATGELLQRISVAEAGGTMYASSPQRMIPTTLSGAAASSTAPSLPSRRVGTAMVGMLATAAIAATTIALTVRALREPATTTRAADTVADEPVVSQLADAATIMVDAAPAPTAEDQTRTSIGAAIVTFARWASAHPDATCPTAEDLDAKSDGWSRPLVITCTDQPAGQQIGIVSLGEDGARGTRDDIVSWTFDPSALDPLRGARRPIAIATPPAPSRSRTRSKPAVAPGASVAPPAPPAPPITRPRIPIDTDGDDIPDTR